MNLLFHSRDLDRARRHVPYRRRLSNSLLGDCGSLSLSRFLYSRRLRSWVVMFLRQRRQHLLQPNQLRDLLHLLRHDLCHQYLQMMKTQRMNWNEILRG